MLWEIESTLHILSLNFRHFSFIMATRFIIVLALEVRGHLRQILIRLVLRRFHFH